ncbi:MAG: type II secretion system protein [Opitutaceae bacterium]|nr:type II secretion system protein [Opitutaceae bacterium]
MNTVQYSSQTRVRRAAFTLVEVLIAATLALLVIGGVLSVMLMAYRSVNKTKLLDEALQNTRQVQEHLTREVAIALHKGPDGTDLGFDFDISDGGAPARYAKLTYMVPIGDPVVVPTFTPKSAQSMVVVCPPDVTPAAGDVVMLGLPNTKDYLRILNTDDPAKGTQRNVTLNFTMLIQEAAALAGTPLADCSDVRENVTWVPIYRKRQYEVADPGGARMTQLQWWENANDPLSRQVLSSSVAADEWHLFGPVMEGSPAAPVDGALLWRFKYFGEGSNLLAGRRDFWETNPTEGRLRARSGDPVNLNGPGGDGLYTTSSSTTTTSIATTSTSSTSSTTTSTTKSTTIATTKSTTIRTTTPTTTRVTTKSTTVPTTTRVTTKSTTVPTTTRVTTKSTTKVTTKSTSTTKATTKSTTAPTTTKATTTKASTVATTSKSTTALSTTKATTTKSTTAPTTSIRDDG